MKKYGARQPTVQSAARSTHLAARTIANSPAIGASLDSDGEFLPTFA
jgi:hypothetical protein